MIPYNRSYSVKRSWSSNVCMMELAQALETVAQNIQTLKASTQGSDLEKSEVHKINDAGKWLTCYRYGKIKSIATKINVVSRTQYTMCGKKRHLKAVCCSKPKGTGQRKRNPHTVKHVQEDDDSEDELPLYHIRSREYPSNKTNGTSWRPPSGDGVGHWASSLVDIGKLHTN